MCVAEEIRLEYLKKEQEERIIELQIEEIVERNQDFGLSEYSDKEILEMIWLCFEDTSKIREMVVELQDFVKEICSDYNKILNDLHDRFSSKNHGFIVRTINKRYRIAFSQRREGLVKALAIKLGATKKIYNKKGSFLGWLLYPKNKSYHYINSAGNVNFIKKTNAVFKEPLG
jgi:hypothetical protein